MSVWSTHPFRCYSPMCYSPMSYSPMSYSPMRKHEEFVHNLRGFFFITRHFIDVMLCHVPYCRMPYAMLLPGIEVDFKAPLEAQNEVRQILYSL